MAHSREGRPSWAVLGLLLAVSADPGSQLPSKSSAIIQHVEPFSCRSRRTWVPSSSLDSECWVGLSDPALFGAGPYRAPLAMTSLLFSTTLVKKSRALR